MTMAIHLDDRVRSRRQSANKLKNMAPPYRILNCSNRDARINSFLAFPSSRTVHIKSRRPFQWWDHITRRSLAVNNRYFIFTDKKRIMFLSANVETTFRPKTYGEVERGDLNLLREDIGKIIDSNSGIGIAYFGNVSGWAVAAWRVCIVIVCIYILFGILRH